jgi:hypothetical protein
MCWKGVHQQDEKEDGCGNIMESVDLLFNWMDDGERTQQKMQVN